jgi:hypothetical protein
MHAAHRFWLVEWVDGSYQFSLYKMALEYAAKLTNEGYEVTLTRYTERGQYGSAATGP